MSDGAAAMDAAIEAAGLIVSLAPEGAVIWITTQSNSIDVLLRRPMSEAETARVLALLPGWEVGIRLQASS